VIEVQGLTVRFGGVVSIDDMTVTFPGGTCGLIGPNGAGKTTFFNVLSGFVTPAAGRVMAFGEDLLSLPDFRRARWGVRRTFQTEQAIESLTVWDNVLTVYEHTSRADRAATRDAVGGALELTGLSEHARAPVGSLGAASRRLVEVARAIVGRPRLVLLDEPAAGLPDEETSQLAKVINLIPEHIGATAIVVEHDMTLVQACCQTVAVLDFGRLLASGPTDEVLHDPRVLEAYLGMEEPVT
jgi:branched-chain amino acid transport system ATP-binding protein